MTITSAIWSVLLFLIVAFPRWMQVAKISLIVAFCFLSIVQHNIPYISKRGQQFLFWWIFATLLSVLVGIVRGNAIAGITSQLSVRIVDVFIYVALFSFTYFVDYKNEAFRAVTAASLFFSLQNIAILVLAFLGKDYSLLQLFDPTARIGFHSGYSHITSTNLSMSIVTYPMMMLLPFSNRYKDVVSSGFLNMTRVLCAIAMLVSGRRILWICLVVSTVVWFFNIKRESKPIRVRTVLLVLIIVCLIYFLSRTGVVYFHTLVERIHSAFTNSNEASNVRLDEIAALMEGFAHHPVFGNGAGAVLPTYVRSETTPWSFEVSYHAQLFQGGLVGTASFFLSLFALIQACFDYQSSDKQVSFAMLTTLVLAIFASGTNPYFTSSFDFLIFLFLPFSFVSNTEEEEKQQLPSDG